MVFLIIFVYCLLAEINTADLQLFPAIVVEKMIKALKLNSREARLRFPRLLQIIERYPAETLGLVTREVSCFHFPGIKCCYKSNLKGGGGGWRDREVRLVSFASGKSDKFYPVLVPCLFSNLLSLIHRDRNFFLKSLTFYHYSDSKC